MLPSKKKVPTIPLSWCFHRSLTAYFLSAFKCGECDNVKLRSTVCSLKLMYIMAVCF